MSTGVNISGIRFKNAVILASGPLSKSKGDWLRAGRSGFGGVVTKSATLAPNEGNPQPRWAFGEGFLVMADGLPNKGYKAIAQDIREAKNEGLSIPIIASVAGTSPEEFALMAAEFERSGADGIELNLGCPHRGGVVGLVKNEPIGRYWSETPERSFAVVKTVKEAVHIPVWAKFPFDIVYKNFEIVSRMKGAGVDGVVPYACVSMGMVIDLETGRPVLGNPRGTGTVAGHAMKPLGVRCVAELARGLGIPVLASGGVMSGLDVAEYVMAGAQAAQVLTAIMKKVKASDIVSGLERFMLDKGFHRLEDFRGKTLGFLP